MSTDQTPALARAAEAINDGSLRVQTPVATASVARAAVSAALHDPDDPDALARLGFDASQELVEVDGVTTRLDWTNLHLSQQQRWRVWADAVRATILGEAR